ncbi:MAG: type III pantothenate kinase [Burkholderiales bacterium]|nr:type III pantothenate kinase [Burkholderiales bacterium]
MNVLAIDIGNTRIKWGCGREGGWLRQGWVPSTRPEALAAEFAGLPAITRAIISCVAGDEVRVAAGAALPAVTEPPLWLEASAAQCGVRSSYADPASLGPDRWAALIGAWHVTGAACVVVNAGTTMTVDALGSDGVFLGGCIVPGARLMREALARDTARLAARDGSFGYFPDNTGDAIFSGTVNALAGAVERMARHLGEITGTAPPVILSGGDAALIEKRLNAQVVVVDNLVLEGLLHIATQPGV